MADADEVAHQQGHRGTPAPARGPFLHGNLRLGQSLLLHDFLHDFLGQQDNLPVEQQESGQAVALNQPELLVQPVGHRRRDGAVATLGGLQAEAAQVAGGSVALGHGGVGQGVTQVVGQVEGALLGDSDGVGQGFRVLAEDFQHSIRRFQAQVMVGPDVGQCLVDGRVAPGGHQGVLQPVALRSVVVDIVAGGQGCADAAGQGSQLPVAGHVSLQEVLLQLQIHAFRAKPVEEIVE